MQNLLIAGNIDRTCRLQDTVNIPLTHFLILDSHHAMTVQAFNMTSRNSGHHFTDLDLGHHFSFFQHTLNSLYSRFNIYHDPTTQPLGKGLPQSDNVIALSIWTHLRHHRHNLGCSHIQGYHDATGIAIGFQHVMTFLAQQFLVNAPPIHWHNADPACSLAESRHSDARLATLPQDAAIVVLLHPYP